jgi:hypothetical protein
VLFFAARVGEAEVNKLDFVFFHHLHHVGNGLVGHQGSPGFLVGWKSVIACAANAQGKAEEI